MGAITLSNVTMNSAGKGESQPEEVREEEPSTEKIERSQSAASFMLDESSVDAPDIVQCTEQLTSIGDEEDSNMSRKFSQFSNDLQLTQRSLSSCSPSSLEFIPPEIAEDSSEQAATCNSDVSPSCSPVLQSQKSGDLLISEDKSEVPVEVHLSEDKPLDGNLVHAQQKLGKKRKRKNTDFVSESVHQIMNTEEDCGRRRSSRRKITK
ncbi:hypothetical protein CAPTEDRAFT_217976 [Capitella teleta]|uniref:Uncharacterized protein n=1 Tax=Capitella teleta TaxID=283909 RepID=R7TB39_CAPTE|nr:hypothetical protein CAPTEDRAFT_217976 [Capitella teleta]|eukprot:ELT88214.1 hypothetical protein CAPTEDRAFT_217976 [Capitella teleta]